MFHTEVLAAVESAAATDDELEALTLTLIGEASCFSDQNSVVILKILNSVPSTPKTNVCIRC